MVVEIAHAKIGGPQYQLLDEVSQNKRYVPTPLFTILRNLTDFIWRLVTMTSDSAVSHSLQHILHDDRDYHIARY